MPDFGSVCLFFKQANELSEQNSVIAIEVYPTGLSLGTAVSVLGQPVSARLCWSYNPQSGMESLITTRIYFTNDVLGVGASGFDKASSQRFDPHILLEKIVFLNNPIHSYIYDEFPWKGFGSQDMIEECGSPPERQ